MMFTFTKILLIAVLFLLFTILYTHSSYLLTSKEYKINIHGIERSYILHTSLKKSDQPLPLVIVLHGYGDHPRLIEFYSQWSRKADKESVFVVYPRGSNTPENNKLSWNAGSCCGFALHNNSDDVAFIQQLIESLVKEKNIDPNRVYITGFSNGALMAQRVASEIPELITAVSSIAGSIGGRLTDNTKVYRIQPPKIVVPILLIHGDEDTAVPYYGGLNSSNDAEFFSANESLLFWAKNNSCTETAKVVDEKSFKKELYAECANTSEVMLITIKGLDHTWPGSILDKVINRRLQAESATNLSSDFFKNKSK